MEASARTHGAGRRVGVTSPDAADLWSDLTRRQDVGSSAACDFQRRRVNVARSVRRPNTQSRRFATASPALASPK